MVYRHDFIFIGNDRCGHVLRLTLLLESEMNDGDITKTDEFIKKDLCAEISCACNNYEIIGMETTILTKDGDDNENLHVKRL